MAGRLWPGDLIFDFVSGSRLAATPGFTNASAQYYFGLDDWACTGFALHATRQHDLCVDIGANIGVYTILASAVRRARVIACEPSPPAFRLLRQNVGLNNVDHLVTLRQVAIGRSSGSAAFLTGQDALNRVLEDGAGEPSETVALETLDRVVAGAEVDIIKIDTVGFEKFGLLGGMETLRGSRLKAVIVGNQRRALSYGVGADDVSDILKAFDFVPMLYDAATRVLILLDTVDLSRETLFVRDPTAMQRRLREAEPFTVFGNSF